MDTRKVSAAVGFTLLTGCVVAVVLVIYQGGSARTSYRTSMEESWKKREMRMKERQEVLGSIFTPSTTEPSTKEEANKLADELQKLFLTNTKGTTTKKVGGTVTVLHGDEVGNKMGTIDTSRTSNDRTSSSSNTHPNTAMNSDKLPSSSLPATAQLPSLPLSFPEVLADLSSQYNDNVKEEEARGKKQKAVPTPRPTEAEAKLLEKDANDNEFYQMAEIPPSINSRLQKIVHDQMSSTKSGKHRSNILLVQSLPSAPLLKSRDPATRHSSASTSPAIYSESLSNLSYGSINRRKDEFSAPLSLHPSMHSAWNNEDISLEDYEDTSQYVMEEKEDVDHKRDPLKAMGNILQVVSDVYKKGTQGLDINGFLRVVNETVQRGNNTSLLTHLNQLYTRPGNWSTLFAPKTEAVGRNALESSLSTFLFMSVGIFLLNQIHKFMGTGGGQQLQSDGHERQARKLEVLDDSDIDFLFQSPTPNSLSSMGNSVPQHSTLQKDQVDIDLNLQKPQNGIPTNSNNSSTVNNMFRAAINLVNAYTKDSQALECIWSKYCQDLDKTAAVYGSLYSLAARINSVGLRLIMGQIPTELTVDVVLRSLLGWDGLPCAKMFSKCQVVEGTLQRLQVPENETVSTTKQTTA